MAQTDSASIACHAQRHETLQLQDNLTGLNKILEAKIRELKTVQALLRSELCDPGEVQEASDTLVSDDDDDELDDDDDDDIAPEAEVYSLLL